MFAPKWVPGGSPVAAPPPYAGVGFPPQQQPVGGQGPRGGYSQSYFPPAQFPTEPSYMGSGFAAPPMYATMPPGYPMAQLPGNAQPVQSHPLQQQRIPPLQHHIPSQHSPSQPQESPPLSPQQQQFTSGEQFTSSDKFKTELCKKFMLTGYCRYGDMCQFAHGAAELRAMVRHPLYKTSPCKSFESTGSCRYGSRCRFIHDEDTQQLATLARGVPALNLQVSEPTWEEAQAATMDAVQHLQHITVTAVNLSPQLAPGVAGTVSTGVTSTTAPGFKQPSPSSAVMPQHRLPGNELEASAALGKLKSPPVSPPATTNPESSKKQQQPPKERSLLGRVKTEPHEMSRVLSSPNHGMAPSSSSVGEIRSISSLIMLNSASPGGQNLNTPSPASTQGRVPRVNSTIRLEEDVFAPANLDARRLPVASSGSWVNLAEMSQPQDANSGLASTGQLKARATTEALRHSYSQPVLGGDTWLSFSESLNEISRPRPPNSSSIASLPVLPPTSPADGKGLPGFVPSTSSPNLLDMYSGTGLNSTEGANFRKAASYANHIWMEATNATADTDQGWSSMARAKSVEGRLNIFRNLSDQDLAKTAQASGKRLPSYDRLGEVGLTLSDDEDNATDEGAGHDTEEDEGFSVGKF